MPIMFSLVSSLIILFGGWYTYQQFYVQKPVEDFIASKQNVVLKHLEINNNQVEIDVDFKDPTTYANDYKDIYDFIHERNLGKTVTIHLPNQGDGLKKLWDQQYFGLAQALELKEYGQIPKIVEDMKKNGKLDQSVARMDDQNIYLYMQEGKDRLYAVLPVKEEVKKNNE